MEVLIAGTLLSLVICVGALVTDWRLPSPGQRSTTAKKSKPANHLVGHR
jgi:hypothetical protein